MGENHFDTKKNNIRQMMDKITNIENLDEHVDQLKKYADEYNCSAILDVKMRGGYTVSIVVKKQCGARP